MNLIDLREFKFEKDKIILFKDGQIIFSNTEYEKSTYKRYFYRFDIETKQTYRVNKIGIDVCKKGFYNTCILDNYIYTNSYTIKGDNIETTLYKVSITTGGVEKLYSVEKDVKVIFLSNRYALLSGSKFEMDKEHCDLKKDMDGEYNYSILCDFIENTEYKIHDTRITLGIRDHFIPYDVDGKRYIVFEESYMEDWELETMYKEKIAKSEFLRNSYKESLNIISLDRFVKAIVEDTEEIPFDVIYKTELTSWVRYFGMDDENIYYRVKDFKTKIEHIYSVNKRTLESQLLKNINIDKVETLYPNNSISSILYNIENRKIYKIYKTNHSTKYVKEVLDECFEFSYNGSRESFEGLVDNYFITSFWNKDKFGNQYKVFVKMRNIRHRATDIYEGICVIINNNIILFR